MFWLVVREELGLLRLRELGVGEVVGERDRLGVGQLFGCSGFELFERFGGCELFRDFERWGSRELLCGRCELLCGRWRKALSGHFDRFLSETAR